MSSQTLKSIIARHPQERQAIERLEEALRTPIDYDVDRLYTIVRPKSERTFYAILMDAIESGILDSYVVVESPVGGGIQEYRTVTDVPDEIDDWRNGNQRLRVQPEFIHVYVRGTDVKKGS